MKNMTLLQLCYNVYKVSLYQSILLFQLKNSYDDSAIENF